jgi:hypothetical protein
MTYESYWCFVEAKAARDAVRYGRPVIYYDESGHAVEAIPEEPYDVNCHRVRKRIWENGKLIKETVEEACGPPAPGVRYYPAPPPPYYYGGWGWPVAPPGFYFYFGRSHHGGRHHR